MKASEVLDNLKRRFPNEPEYHQAVSEVLGTIEEVYNEHPEFEKTLVTTSLLVFFTTLVVSAGSVVGMAAYAVDAANRAANNSK